MKEVKVSHIYIYIEKKLKLSFYFRTEGCAARIVEYRFSHHITHLKKKQSIKNGESAKIKSPN